MEPDLEFLPPVQGEILMKIFQRLSIGREHLPLSMTVDVVNRGMPKRSEEAK